MDKERVRNILRGNFDATKGGENESFQRGEKDVSVHYGPEQKKT